MQKLDAVNYCLVQGGQSPVQSLDEDTVSDVRTVLFLVEDATQNALVLGQANNTYISQLVPQVSSGEILLPAGTLSASLVEEIQSTDFPHLSVFAVPRDGKLFNQTDRTFVWTQSSLHIFMTETLEWENLDGEMQRLIMLLAAKTYNLSTQGDVRIDAALDRDIQFQRVRAISHDISRRNRNLLDGPDPWLVSARNCRNRGHTGDVQQARRA